MIPYIKDLFKPSKIVPDWPTLRQSLLDQYCTNPSHHGWFVKLLDQQFMSNPTIISYDTNVTVFEINLCELTAMVLSKMTAFDLIAIQPCNDLGEAFATMVVNENGSSALTTYNTHMLQQVHNTIYDIANHSLITSLHGQEHGLMSEMITMSDSIAAELDASIFELIAKNCTNIYVPTCSADQIVRTIVNDCNASNWAIMTPDTVQWLHWKLNYTHNCDHNGEPNPELKGLFKLGYITINDDQIVTIYCNTDMEPGQVIVGRKGKTEYEAGLTIAPFVLVDVEDQRPPENIVKLPLFATCGVFIHPQVSEYFNCITFDTN